MPLTITASGIKGQDVHGHDFGIYFAQVGGLKRLPCGTKIYLKTGEVIETRYTYEHVSSALAH